LWRWWLWWDEVQTLSPPCQVLNDWSSAPSIFHWWRW
jgi:hypothetical protein